MIADQLHPLERKVIPFLKDNVSFEELMEQTKLKDVEVMRALQWLSNKDILTINKSRREMIALDDNGLLYAKDGLPEMRFLKVLNKTPEDFVSLDDIQQEAGLSQQEAGVSLGALKSKVAISTENKDKRLFAKIAPQGKKILEKESLEEQFLNKSFPIELSALKDEERFAYDNLSKRRQIIKLDSQLIITISLKPKAEELLQDKSSLSVNYEDSITHEMLKSGNWKDNRFRHYDIKINVPKISGGKRHFVRQSIDYIKKVWLELGFKEMEGNLIQSAFWDLDALFVPQDHPARTEQDTFYIKDPAKAKLPAGLKAKIKAIHETGGDTGSRGWGGKWSEDEASVNLLRTHTTVLSARTIANLKPEDLPAKFFSVNKVFRNESLTWKHLFEFHQVEGIVIDPNATLKHLKGYLREFYQKLGFEKVRMRPAHFPYTEPSLEVDVFHPEKKEWIELGGAGIFRPELVKPLLGIEVPVLAWGQGLERGIMQYYGFDDIRKLYDNDIKTIKEVKIWK
ncbi:phenylalanine--tRNA ligase subunit alpha [Candidatus Woesearchaeota archaeon]|nr:phenylalanine--tRNA ligase subunit alpha [Candidatus Woesearchaeota archaeon]